MEEVQILQLDPVTFEAQTYKTSDETLITTTELDTVFSSSTDYIEFYIYDENQNLIYPSETIELTSYTVKEGDVLLDPQKDLESLGFDLGTYNILYTFYRKRVASDIQRKYYIREISSDRTEIRLDSNDIENRAIVDSANRFISYREQSSYFVDFYLNFGQNQTVIANNLRLDNTVTEDPTLLVKLYEPLPEAFDIKSTVSIVEQLSTPQAYQVTFPFIATVEDDFKFLSGPNFNLEVKSTTGNSGQLYSYNSLLSTNLTSSQNQIKNILNSKGISISIDYENFSEFINFSSAKTRLENFYYKVGLIESYTNSISASLGEITSGTTSSLAYSSSVSIYESRIQEIINNFDGYENFLYYDSGSLYSYPKVNTSPPYTLYSTGSSQVLNWIGSATEGDPYYGGMALSASDYDQNNNNWLYFAIPEYLREDPDNAKYELFVDMVGQHYDNIWIYTKDITNRFNADNRLDYGISKDLVADAIRDFGVKLYSNNFNTEELYTAFLGLTPSGSLFPFPNLTETLPAPSGSEYITTKISASNDAISLDGVNKRLYKKLYHNLPYILKTKGTVAGLRALITSYGIPDTILRINEFGGKDRNNSLDWDYTYNQFNYALDLDGTNYLTSSFDINDKFSTTSPKTLQFRFKTKGIPTGSGFDHSYQTLWMGNTNTSTILLEYTQSLASGSYTGSIQDEYKYYGTLKFLPEAGVHPYFSASINLPFFDGGWWSVMATLDYSTPTASATLWAANKIGNDIGFTGSSTVAHGDIANYWDSVTTSSFPNSINYTLEGTTYKPFSGSLQEIRYYSEVLSGSLFYDYTVNPFAFEGNTINSAPDTLAFRADLGTLLNTGSRTSVHPKVTGSSAYITSSFDDGSSFYINQDTFIVNKEYIAADQPAVGIKNRITDKIQVEDYILPTGDTLSPYRSIQQTSFVSQSYTPNINYLEVAFSPQDEINDDIIAQIGYFNVGDYIGDPRQISQSNYNYPDLDTLRDAYFNKYINSYDVVDFVRLIKFFDNSLFKMIKDFTPARTSLSSGVVIKQHLLERNRQRPALVSYTDVTYSGSIKPQSRNYDTGSGDVGQYEYVSGSSIYRFSGGTGGSADRYNGLHTSPSASAYGLTNRFFLTQSYSESFDGPAGPREVTNFNQNEFYNGIFSGSTIVATTRSLNPGCDPYLRVADLPVQYFPMFFNDIITPFYGGTVTKDDWSNPLNAPLPGDAWIFTQDAGGESFGLTTTYIKLARLDYNGVDIADYIGDSNRVEFIFPESGEGTEYYINGFVVHPNNVILTISQTEGNYTVTGSANGGSENWSLIAKGNYTSSTTNDYTSQGDFTRLATTQTQYFKYWNGTNQDALGFMDTGSSTVFAEIDATANPNITNADYYTVGTYNPLRTTNLPWIISASISYSASDTGLTAPEVQGRLINGGVYDVWGHEDQSFTIDSLVAKPGVISGSYSLSTIVTPTAEDVSSDFFNLNVSNQVPGYKYPGAIAAGNRQVKEPGTASLDFHFDNLILSASNPSGINPAYSARLLSGSALTGSNTDFYPYAGFTSGSNGTALVSGSYFVSASTDGVYRLNYGEVDAVYNLDPLENINFSITINFDIITLPSSTPAPLITPKLDLLKSIDGTTYTVEATRYFYSAGSYSLSYVDTSTFNKATLGSRYFKLRFSHHTGELEYDLTQWRVDVASANNTINLIDSRYQQVKPGDGDGNVNVVGEYYSFVAKAKLMYTGSNGDPAREITSSADLTFTSLFTSSAHTLTFPDSPILGIFDDNPASNSNTINTTQSLYYVEYEISDWEISASTALVITPLNNTNYPQVYITNSIAGAGDYYDLTGSLQVYHGNADNSPLEAGAAIFNATNAQFIVPTSESTGTFSISGVYQGPFDYNDTFRMGVSVNRNYLSGLAITQYTMSIWPTSSVLGTVNEGESRYGVAVYGQEVYGGTGDPIAPGYNNYAIPVLTDLVVPSFFNSRDVNVLPFSLALDCQPFLNNYLSARSSSFLMDVDYNIATGSITPVNLAQILDNTAVKADVPDSNYTAKSMILPRYEGSKSTSKLYNLWSYTDEGTYGQLPTVELRKAYIGYFDGVDDPYPLYNDVTRINLTYLVDLVGNALPPSLDKSSKAILEKVFTQDEGARIAALSGSSLVKELNDLYKIERLGGYPTPIMYTQTSSNGFSNNISLTSSRRFDRFDIKETTDVEYFKFTAFGSSSAAGFPLTNFSQDLDPTEQIKVRVSATDPYTTGGGVIDFPGVSVGDEVTNTQRINVETSVITSFLYEGENAEINLKLSLLSGSTYIAPQLEDIRLKVYKDDNSTQDLGSLIDIPRLYSSQGDIIKFVGTTANKKFNTVRSTNYASKFNTTVLNRQNQIEVEINATALNKYLQNKGVYRGSSKKAQNNPLNILGYEFTLIANSGVTTFKGGDNVKWNLAGVITGNSTKTRVTTYNQFYPSNINSPRYFPTKLSMQGALDHLFPEAPASAPFWIYSGSISGSTASPARPVQPTDLSNGGRILVMSSSVINDGYGVENYQGQLPYVLGPSEYFPDGYERKGSSMGPVRYPIEIKENDEIRFGNNENYTYRIIKVFPPQQNIEASGSINARLKIELDRPVPADVNKDFFLIRRFIPDANSIYLNVPFPWKIPPSASSSPGIIYPEFPTIELEQSASIIVTDLVSKGIIK